MQLPLHWLDFVPTLSWWRGLPRLEPDATGSLFGVHTFSLAAPAARAPTPVRPVESFKVPPPPATKKEFNCFPYLSSSHCEMFGGTVPLSTRGLGIRTCCT